MEIPKQPNSLHFRSDHWPVVAGAMHLLATTGISMRFELQDILASQRGIAPRSGSLRRIFEKDLLDEELIVTETFPTFGWHRLAVVQLTDKGKDLCRSFGWTVIGSEWERMQTLHSADNQPRHTGALLIFAHHARLRDWTVQVLPSVESPVLFPDALVEKNGQRIYVEVEIGSRKSQKWRNMQRVFGYVALCAKTSATRRSLIDEGRAVGAHGLATDLETLYLDKEAGRLENLWSEEWR
jgi:hypothetical protein